MKRGRVVTIRAFGRYGRGVLLVLLCSYDAFAEGSVEPRARALFDEGRSLVKSGRYDEACPKFEKSVEVDAGLGTEFNLADCWERIGLREKARTLFLEVAEKAHAVGQVGREQVARARAAALLPKAEDATPSTTTVPTVVISSAEPTVEALSTELGREYGSLAEAEVQLRDLAQRAALLFQAVPEDSQARRVRRKIAAVETELAEEWKVAGRLTTQIAWRAARSPKALARSASDTKILAAPSPVHGGAVRIASVPAAAR